MASETHGSILLSTADSVSRMLMKKLDSQTGFKPSEWTDNINLLGALPIRTASGTIAHFSDGAEDVPMKSIVANIVPIQSGTGTPSPSNPRPISGTSVLNVTQQGANLFDYSTLQTGYRVIWGSGIDYADASASKSDYILVKEGARLRFTASVYVLGYDTEKTYLGSYDISTQSWLKQSGSLVDDITIPTGTAYIKIMDFGSISGTITNAFVVNYGATQSTNTTYRTGSTYAVNLGQTVYGGTADVVGGAGEETWKRIKIRELGTFSRYSNFFNVNISGTGFDSSADYYCEVFNNVGLKYDTAMSQQPEFSLGYSGNSLKFRYDSTTDPTQFLNDVGDYYIVHKLATPESFTFTGQPINSYLGVNNVWTDSGEVLDVEYRADMNLLIAELEG